MNCKIKDEIGREAVIVGIIKAQRIKWRLKSMEWQAGRRSKRGRPRQRWIGQVIRCVKNLEVQEQKETTKVRKILNKLAKRNKMFRNT